LLGEYRRCAGVCAAIDYSDMRTVRANNRAVARMYELVRAAAKSGPTVVNALIVLLDEPDCSAWIAHQLLECCKISKDTERRCLRIIEKMATEDVGEELWLKEYRTKRRRR